MIETIETHLTYVPFTHIRRHVNDFRFRLPNAMAVTDLRASLARTGQTHPALLEEMEPQQFLVLDGHRRCDAVQLIHDTGGTWEKILAHVIPMGSLNPLYRLRLIRDRNLVGKDPYGLIERGRFFQHSVAAGLSVLQVAEECGLSAHAVDDYIELANTPPDLASLLNHAPLEPALALMLARRFEGWLRTPHPQHAMRIANQLVRHANQEKHSVKSWRFLLDFYWPQDRPFLA